MLRTLTAETFEIDSPEEAAAEILEQITTEQNLLLNSIGIVACHPDFIASGALKAVCAQFPFPIVGATTLASGTNKAYGLEQLSLCVLTADDVTFTPALSTPLTENPQDAIAGVCAAAGGTEGDPALALTYLPFLPQPGGNAVVKHIDSALHGVPIFGTVGCDYSSDMHETQIIFNGESYRDRLALVLVRGAVDPKFFVISVSEGNIQQQKGIITDADGTLLKGVNDMPSIEYMASIGLNPNDGLEGVSSIPFMVDYKDGSPPAGRSLYTFTPEGHAICGGEMPQDATLAVGLLNTREITRAGEKLFANILEKQTPRGILVISCIGRSLALGLEPLAEVETVRQVVGEAAPLHMSYSGGEVCPVYTAGGNTVNRFHNFTLIACIL